MSSDDLRHAMKASALLWTGTSIFEGALKILDEVSRPHVCRDIGGACSQCGKKMDA